MTMGFNHGALRILLYEREVLKSFNCILPHCILYLPMYIIIWEYKVHSNHRSLFLEYYRPDGVWAKFFRQTGDYISTNLLMSDAKEPAFITIDKWVSKESYETFLNTHETKYRELDSLCEQLTSSEKQIGKYFAFVE